MKPCRTRPMLILLALLGTGCALHQPPLLVDLGAAPISVATNPGLPALRMSLVQAPPWLDEPRMLYRLLYENPLEVRAYTTRRWLMAPGLLFEQRVRQRLVAAGRIVLAATDTTTGMPTLKIELDDFMQNFSDPASSSGRVLMRASLYTGQQLLAQHTFYGQVAASSADAAGGARALAGASDVAIEALLHWLAALQFNP